VAKLINSYNYVGWKIYGSTPLDGLDMG